METTFDPRSKFTWVRTDRALHGLFFQRIKGEAFLWILSSYNPHFLTIMSSDQCALNPDGSLKDPKDIQWFNDAEDAQPLPSPAAPAQHLGRGLRNKTTSRFSDAVARERLGSDEEDLDGFTEPPKRKRTLRALNISDGAAPPSLSLSNSFETLLVEESSDDDQDGSFRSDSGSESDNDSSDKSTPDLELISNDEVRVQLLSHDLECLPNVIAARQCSAEEDGCGSQLQ